MSKKIAFKISMILPAGKVTPQVVGTVLGPKGVNIVEFSKNFNASTQHLALETPVRVFISIFEDKKFSFEIKSSPVSFYLKELLNLSKGSSLTKKGPSIGKIKMSDCVKISTIKIDELNTGNILLGAKMIRGSALSMGIEVEDDLL